MRKDVERFIQKRLSKNEGFVQAYRDELKALKGGQSPECYVSVSYTHLTLPTTPYV